MNTVFIGIDCCELKETIGDLRLPSKDDTVIVKEMEWTYIIGSPYKQVVYLQLEEGIYRSQSFKAGSWWPLYWYIVIFMLIDVL